jgi:hypothetical protein
MQAETLIFQVPKQPPAEEYLMTFQVALVGTDGVVLGSDRLFDDRRHQWRSDHPLYQNLSQRVAAKKIIISNDGSVVCGFAGGPESEPMARAIATNARPQGMTELDWKNRVEEPRSWLSA